MIFQIIENIWIGWLNFGVNLKFIQQFQLLLPGKQSPAEYLGKVLLFNTNGPHEIANICTYIEELQCNTQLMQGLKWCMVETQERHVFFSCVFLVVLLELPEHFENRLSNEFYSAQKAFNSKIISKNIFQSILKFLRL